MPSFVKVPDLRIHSWGTRQNMRPPAGFALVERGDHPKLWRTIRNNDFNAYVVVGIDVAGELVADPRYAFVPAAQKAAAAKPSLVDVADDSERSAAAEREIEILRWARRLAVPAFAGTPFEGRAFWPEASADRPIAATVNGVDGVTIPLRLFVTNDEAAVQRTAAAAYVDRQIVARSEKAPR